MSKKQIPRTGGGPSYAERMQAKRQMENRERVASAVQWTMDAATIAVNETFHYSPVFKHLGAFQKTGDRQELITAAVHCLAEDDCSLIAEKLMALARHFENGARKYGEHNWEKGLPVSCYLDSAARHLVKQLAGWEDEDHESAFLWNLVCAIWTIDNRPEQMDIPARMEGTE